MPTDKKPKPKPIPKNVQDALSHAFPNRNKKPKPKPVETTMADQMNANLKKKSMSLADSISQTILNLTGRGPKKKK